MTEFTGRSRRISLKKRLAFGAMALVLSLPAVELVSWAAINFVTAGGMKQMRILQDGLLLGGSASNSSKEVIHPYLGWVMNPDLCPPTVIGERRIPVNRFGFNDEEDALPKRGADRLVVGVVGGSVAWQMTALGESALRETLRQNADWRDREIQLVRLAMPGFKQPQQLMALNYVLALGAEFDVVVNVDGYNEIALPVCENEKADVFAAYPRMWHLRTLDMIDPRLYTDSFRFLEARAMRQELARGIHESWFRWSPTINLVWKVRDLYWENRLLALAAGMAEQKAAHRFAAQGPARLDGDDDELFSHLGELWRNSSLQIHHLCLGNGTKYVHVLQPNQYVPGSKPLSALEREKMVIESQSYGQSIARGYPLLIEEGSRLRKRGVDFHDLTMLFAKVEEPTYADPYCHFNARGNEILARAVAEAVCNAFGSATEHKQTGVATGSR